MTCPETCYIICNNHLDEGGLGMNKQVYPVNQLRVFINTINDLSAELLLQEAMDEYNRKSYNDRIEEALLEKDEEKFMKYTNLLKELTDEDTEDDE